MKSLEVMGVINMKNTPKIFYPLHKLQYEIKIKNKIVADKTIKGILSREIRNR